MTAALRWTSADLLVLPEDGRLQEILDGEPYVSTQPLPDHQIPSANFAGEFTSWDAGRRFVFTAIAPDLVFPDDDDVAPDVAWISRERRFATESGGKLNAAPEILSESLSPGPKDSARARDANKAAMSRRGVDEYWNADWPRCRLAAYRRGGALLTMAGLLSLGDTPTGPLLPGFAVPIDRLSLGIPFPWDSLRWRR